MSENKSLRGCLWGIGVLSSLIMIFCIGILLTGIMMWKTGCVAHTRSSDMGEDEYPQMDEVWASGRGDTKIIKIPLHGFIDLQSTMNILGPSQSSSKLALMAIRRATQDVAVRAILIDIDSGGGGITASDILYKALVDFKESQPGRVVVAMCGDVVASGAYYVSLAADHIIAHPTTVTGSIGVLIQGINLHQFSEKIGIKDVTIKSGKNKDLLNPFREISPEQEEILQRIVNEMHERFVMLVAKQRKIGESDVRDLADGRIITALEAEKLGLIDQVGYLDDAITTIITLLDVDEVKVYRYEEAFSFSHLFRSIQRFNLAEAFLQNMSQPRLLYRWTL